MEPEYWIIVAVCAYWLYFLAIFEAFKPTPPPTPDWFWTGGAWVRSDQPGVVYGQYESFKPEPSDPPASKPESGAG